jgi:hypothetical protein
MSLTVLVWAPAALLAPPTEGRAGLGRNHIPERHITLIFQLMADLKLFAEVFDFDDVIGHN